LDHDTIRVARELRSRGRDQEWPVLGYLTYIDHGSPQMKVKGMAVTAYTRTGENSRQIGGAADIDRMGGTYVADVMDGGEPGRGTDTFNLTLSTGYTAGGLLGGGNIQLHCR
jgi:hypothetical protein